MLHLHICCMAAELLAVFVWREHWKDSIKQSTWYWTTALREYTARVKELSRSCLGCTSYVATMCKFTHFVTVTMSVGWIHSGCSEAEMHPTLSREGIHLAVIVFSNPCKRTVFSNCYNICTLAIHVHELCSNTLVQFYFQASVYFFLGLTWI